MTMASYKVLKLFNFLQRKNKKLKRKEIRKSKIILSLEKDAIATTYKRRNIPEVLVSFLN